MVASWQEMDRAERRAIFEPMWVAGESASAIANAIPGATRNMVIGAVRRANLARRAPTVERKKKVATQNRKIVNYSFNQPKPVVLPGARRDHAIAWLAIEGTDPIGIMDLNGTTCRWPIGDVPVSFCGCPAAIMEPYCSTHMEMMKPCRPKITK